MTKWQSAAVASAALAYLSTLASTPQAGLAFAGMGAAAGLAAILIRGGGGDGG